MKPDACLGCPLYDAPGIVLGEGPNDAQIMFVGEAPGEEEIGRGPFVGGAGRVLNVMLRQAGVERKQCYVTNVVKCRPPFNRPPTVEEITHCGRFLVAEVDSIKPNVIVGLGRTPLFAFTGKDSIIRHRGYITQAGGTKYLPTLHPAFVMRQQSMWPVVVLDLIRAKQLSVTREHKRVPLTHVTSPSGEDLERIVTKARALGQCTFDLETTGLDWIREKIICNGLGVEEGEAYCFAWNENVARATKDLLLDERIEKVGQNSEHFDIPFLEHVFQAEMRGPSFDTLEAFHLTNSDLPKNLGFIASFYVDFEFWKGKKETDLFAYNCYDVDATTRARNGLRSELSQLGMFDLYYNSVMPLQPVLRRMTARGLRQHRERAVAWAIAMERQARELEEKLKEGIGYEFDVNSPKQLQKLLYETMGLPVQYVKDPRTKEMRPTANAEAISNLARISSNPILQLIVEIRTLDKWRSTFLEVECDERDFVHPRFGSVHSDPENDEGGRGPATGRLCSWGPNAQNIPSELREVYLPDDDDSVLLASDWSQIEWRLAVILSADPVGLELLASGRDNHRAVASEVLGKKYEDVTDEERYRAKFVVYGLGYGRGAESIAKQYGIPLGQVQEFIARFSSRFRAFWNWRDSLPPFVHRNYYLVNPFGRRRWWYSRQVTEIYNFPAQSTAADMMYRTLIALERELPRGSSLRLTVHDEVVVNAKREIARQARECLMDVMNRTWPEIVQASARPDLVKMYYPAGWSCPADVHIGLNWKETKKGNPVVEKEVLG